MWTKAGMVSLSAIPRDTCLVLLHGQGGLTELDDVANNSHDQESHADGL